jgi:hypothetical protein
VSGKKRWYSRIGTCGSCSQTVALINVSGWEVTLVGIVVGWGVMTGFGVLSGPYRILETVGAGVDIILAGGTDRQLTSINTKKMRENDLYRSLSRMIDNSLNL